MLLKERSIQEQARREETWSRSQTKNTEIYDKHAKQKKLEQTERRQAEKCQKRIDSRSNADNEKSVTRN